jgi:hypothetical protein
MRQHMYRLWKSMLSLRNRALEARESLNSQALQLVVSNLSDPFGTLSASFFMTCCLVVDRFAPVAPFSSDLQAEIHHNTYVLDLINVPDSWVH